jgi:multidrug efflux pump subunit AcrB
MFSNVGNYSINFQGGALIVIDGVKRGTDASILNSIPITDIAKVTATTSPSELQRYSAMNSSGLVEITTKKGYAAKNKPAAQEQKESSNLFWKPDLNTDTSGKAKITYRNNDEAQDVFLTVEGITSDGLTGSSTISYKVK